VTIRLRLTIYWTLITAALLLAAGAMVVFLFSREMWGGLDAALMEEADTSAVTLSHSPGGAASIIGELSREKDIGPRRRVRLIVDGRVAIDDGDPRADVPAPPPENNAGESIVNGSRHGFRYALVALSFNGHRAWLEDGVDASRVRRAIAHLWHTSLLVIPLILGLCVVGGYWMSARALAPLNDITGALGRIGPRDLRQRIPLGKVRDEAGRLSEAINQLLERLDRASASQRRFISEAAHELRTPLTVLRSGLEVALQKQRSAEENRAALEQALGEAERLCSIAQDLLALARLEAEPAAAGETVDLKEVAAEAAAMAGTLAHAKEQTLALAAPQKVVVKGSAADLRRVVLNLLDNAIKFTPQRGTIEVEVAREDGAALLAVRDNGPGIASQDMPHIFEPFYRSRGANSAGSGLGLALSREIISLHGGAVRAANRSGGGCAVEVRIPLAAA
jgi:two-component system, OmpR family, heavy metal sensor histidine kinase CusS